MPSQAVPMTNPWALLNITPALSHTSKATCLKSAEQIQCTYRYIQRSHCEMCSFLFICFSSTKHLSSWIHPFTGMYNMTNGFCPSPTSTPVTLGGRDVVRARAGGPGEGAKGGEGLQG